MALKTKAKIASIGEALGKRSVDFTFQDPALIDAPNTVITKLDGSPRQLPDPSKIIRPMAVVDRVPIFSIKQNTEEKGPDGEIIYDTEDSRAKLIGEGWEIFSSAVGTRPFSSNIGDSVEITFYGTGLNILTGIYSSSLQVASYIDGVLDSSDIFTENYSGVIDGFGGGRSNQLLTVASGLSLGLHTVRLEITAAVAFNFFGFEVLNEVSNIQIPEGSILAAGRKYHNSALETLNINSDFEGSPTLNGRGGNVIIYITPEGTLKKVLQQTDASSANLASANHSNESVIDIHNFREFGNGLVTDFSTLGSSASDRFFTMEDNTTILVGDSVGSATGSKDYLQFAAATSYYSITFVGTGLDVEWVNNGTTDENVTVYVDGVNIGNLTPSELTEDRIIKIVSGLPFGSHNVKFERNSGGTTSAGVANFIVYGPKEPSIPEDSQRIGQYYLVADFDGSLVVDDNQEQLPVGGIFKQAVKEFVYTGTWSINGSIPISLGLRTILGNTVGSTIEYKFFGDAFMLHFDDSDQVGIVDISIDGVLDATGVPRRGVVNDGGGQYTIQNLAGNPAPMRVEFTGLSLDYHTVTITVASGSANVEFVGISCHTPMYSYRGKKIGNSYIDTGVKVDDLSPFEGIDLESAKAWVVYNQSTNQIYSSKNIAAAIDAAVGETYFFFEKRFKRDPVLIGSRNGSSGGGAGTVSFIRTDTGTGVIEKGLFLSGFGVDSQFNDAKGDAVYLCVVAFGELENEESE